MTFKTKEKARAEVYAGRELKSSFARRGRDEPGHEGSVWSYS
jgi:hypothetical protein